MAKPKKRPRGPQTNKGKTNKPKKPMGTMTCGECSGKRVTLLYKVGGGKVHICLDCGHEEPTA